MISEQFHTNFVAFRFLQWATNAKMELSVLSDTL